MPASSVTYDQFDVTNVIFDTHKQKEVKTVSHKYIEIPIKYRYTSDEGRKTIGPLVVITPKMKMGGIFVGKNEKTGADNKPCMISSIASASEGYDEYVAMFTNLWNAAREELWSRREILKTGLAEKLFKGVKSPDSDVFCKSFPHPFRKVDLVDNMVPADTDISEFFEVFSQTYSGGKKITIGSPGWRGASFYERPREDDDRPIIKSWASLMRKIVWEGVVEITFHTIYVSSDKVKIRFEISGGVIDEITEVGEVSEGLEKLLGGVGSTKKAIKEAAYINVVSLMPEAAPAPVEKSDDLDTFLEQAPEEEEPAEPAEPAEEDEEEVSLPPPKVVRQRVAIK